MKAALRSVRIAPKKAELIAKMVRGKSVPDAVYLLERTNKKGARLLQDLLRSAMANASHNEKQDPQMLVIRSLIVNKAEAYHRGVPMARGRVRPIRKFLSHIELRLGVADDEKKPRNPKKTASPKVENPVQKAVTASKKMPSASAAKKKSAAKTSTKGKSSKKETTSSPSKSSKSSESSASSESSK